MSGGSAPKAPGVFTEVARENGEAKTIRVVEGQLFVCLGCCCGNTERGHPALPLDRFKAEWKSREIRSRVHLTVSGCLGPCAVSNVVLFLYRGETVWFHSINSESDVVLIYDYIDRLLAGSRFVAPSGPLAGKVFQRYGTDHVCTAKGGAVSITGGGGGELKTVS